MSKSAEQMVNFDLICRLCLAEKRGMSSIFVKNDVEVPLHEKIMSCASIMLFDGDGLPAQICSKCLQAVNESYALRSQVENADSQLREMLQHINEQTDENNTTHLEKCEDEEIEYLEDVDPKEDVEYLEVEDSIDGKSMDDNTTEEKTTYQITLNLDKHVELSSDSFLLTDSVLNVGEGVDSENHVVGVGNPVGLMCPVCFLLCPQEEFLTHLVTHSEQQNEEPSSQAENEIPVNTEFDDQSPETVNIRIVKRECTSCGFMANEKGGLAKHLRSVHGNGDQLKCTTCNKYVWKVLYQKHMEDFHEDGFGTCLYCGLCVDHLQSHIKEAHKTIICSICLVNIPTELDEHNALNHNNEISHFCPICNREFFDLICFKNHVKLKHQKEKTFLCTLCSFSTSYLASINKHYMAAHSKNEKFVCSICSKEFRVKDNLTKHIRTTHNKKSRTRCVICGKEYFANRELANHMRLHTGDLPFQCEFCERRFPKKSSWMNHRRIHTGEKIFRCNECSESFRVNNQLKLHLFREHGKEEYRRLDRSLSAKASVKVQHRPSSDEV